MNKKQKAQSIPKGQKRSKRRRLPQKARESLKRKQAAAVANLEDAQV